MVARGVRPARVVVIDDCTDLRDLLRFALLRGGMDVVGEAGDGRAGIDVVRAQRPDAVILDLSMPVMDGLEALPYLREIVPDARIILFSGFDPAQRQMVLASGADGHLVKGSSFKAVVAHLEDMLVGRLQQQEPGPARWKALEQERPLAAS